MSLVTNKPLPAPAYAVEPEAAIRLILIPASVSGVVQCSPLSLDTDMPESVPAYIVEPETPTALTNVPVRGCPAAWAASARAFLILIIMLLH